jgi:hypothetical protein
LALYLLDPAFFFSGKKNQKPRRSKNSPVHRIILFGVLAYFIIVFTLPIHRDIFPLTDGKKKQGRVFELPLQREERLEFPDRIAITLKLYATP